MHRPMSDEAAAYWLLGLALACALTLIGLPRPVVPADLPGLVLPATAVREQLEADARAAARAPADDTVRELQRLLAEHSRAERDVVEDLDSYTKRRRLLGEAQAAVLAKHGPAGLDALRGLAAERLQQALDMRLPEAELPGVMGAFAHLLAHNRAVVDGVELAPHFVLRTLYKARWNLLCGLAPVAGLSAVERLAYYGWMGLQSRQLPAREQLDALERYRDEGGQNAPLALGMAQLLGGNFAKARSELSEAYRVSPTFRLRNFLLATELGIESTGP